MYGGILQSATYMRIIYVNMEDVFVNMQLIFVNMQDYYYSWHTT